MLLLLLLHCIVLYCNVLLYCIIFIKLFIHFTDEYFAFTMCLQCSQRPREGARHMWVLRLELGSSARAANILIHRAFSPSALLLNTLLLVRVFSQEVGGQEPGPCPLSFGLHICWHCVPVIFWPSLFRNFIFPKLWCTQVERIASWALIASHQMSVVSVLSPPKPCYSRCTKDLGKTTVSPVFPLHSLKFHLCSYCFPTWLLPMKPKLLLIQLMSLSFTDLYPLLLLFLQPLQSSLLLSSDRPP